MAHDAFISYSSKDKITADTVCAVLEREGIRCWIAPRNVVAGMEWGECIIEAIEQSRVLVLVFTAEADASPQVRREVERAVNRGVSILPLRVEDVMPGRALEYFIANVHWFDALTPPLETHLQNLVATIKTLLARPPARRTASIPLSQLAELSKAPASGDPAAPAKTAESVPGRFEKTPSAPEARPGLASERPATAAEFDREASRDRPSASGPSRDVIPSSGERIRPGGASEDSAALESVSAGPGHGKARLMSLAMGGIVLLLVIGCLAFWMTHRTDPRVQMLQAKDFSHAPFDDPDYADCRNVQPCIKRAAQAVQIVHQDWNAVPYNSALLDDCMGYQPCLARKARAGQLAAVTDWSNAPKSLLADCMGYQPCEQAKSARVRPHGTQGASGSDENLPACCNGDAKCLAAKQKEGIPDCAYPSDDK